MRQRYADTYRGWPVAPKQSQHPVRASFLDPRVGPKYHFGIDVCVRDDRREAGAPAGRTHRVYALEGGRVWATYRRNDGTGEGWVRLGHFGYGHVDPAVKKGDLVQPGEMIGWTLDGNWHVHVTEWFFPGGDRSKRIPINPLRKGGKIAPYLDLAPPQILDVRFSTSGESPWAIELGRVVFRNAGLPIDPKKLFGLVDVRARIEDPQSFQSWLKDVPVLQGSLRPARVHLTVTRLANGKRIVDRDVFRVSLQMAPSVGMSRHYAPGTRQNLRARMAVDANRPGRGELWFRLFATRQGAYWDTTRIPNGAYRLGIAAWDVSGGKGTETADVVVKN